jgi:hypothetical protein
MDEIDDIARKRMKTLYLALTVVGFAIPAVFAPLYALEHPDNVLFLTNPAKTLGRALTPVESRCRWAGSELVDKAPPPRVWLRRIAWARWRSSRASQGVS